MNNTYFISDTHFGHKKLAEKFTDRDGTKARPFESVEKMDNTMVEIWNRIVNTNDKVIHLGDIVMNSGNLDVLYRVKGEKELILGNHDSTNMSEYLKHFKKIMAYKTLVTKSGIKILLSHIPVHCDAFPRWDINVTGHLHNKHINDSRYINICVEQTNYSPITLDTILNMWEEKKRTYE